MLLNLETLVKKHVMDIIGVVHIGANDGIEYFEYKKLSIVGMVFFEPENKSYNRLLENIGHDTNVISYNLALGSKAGEYLMYSETKNNGQSNSLLRPSLHTQYYPDIEFETTIPVHVETLDYVLQNPYMYNFINCDVQGFELECFKGASSVIKNHIDYIYCEVNREPLYENCAMVEEIDEFLSQYNFKRVETKWTNQGWGDALYIKYK